MAEGLKLKIGADVGEALQGMTAVEQRSLVLQKSIARLQTIIGNTRSPQQLSSALAALSQRQAELNKITAAAPQTLNTLTKSSGQATLALTNLGRVAQDAPFGFLGIANNLNPLLESFQRLKATTGSTGGALKALGKSLTGAGGLGIALSVVSSAVLFAQMGFSLWTKKTKEAKEETDQLAESVAKSLVTLTSLVGIVQNVNSSNEDRVKALKAINEQYAKYIPNLEKEGITANNIALAYDTITEALLRQAVVKGLQAEIQKEVEATAGKIIKLTKEQERLRLESDKSVKPVYEKIAADKILQRGQESLTKATTDGFIAQQKQSQATKAQIGSTNVLGQVINKLKEDLKETLKPLLNLTTSFEDLDVSIKEVKVKPDKVVVKPKRIQIDISESGSQIGADINKVMKYFFDKSVKVGLTIPLPDAPPEDIKPVAVSAATLFSKEFTEYFKKPGVIDFSLIKAVREEGLLTDAEKLAKATAEAFTSGLSGAISGGISSFASGIGEALAGGDVRSAFAAFGNSIGSGLQAIGEQLIAIGVAALLAKEALKKLFSNPAVAIAAGIALTVAGAAFKSVLSKGLSARASGGPVTAGNPYLVGEVGREVFVPSVSGSIIPNNQIGSFSGRSQMATVRVTGRLRGNDMILQNARTNRMQTRLG